MLSTGLLVFENESQEETNHAFDFVSVFIFGKMSPEKSRDILLHLAMYL